VIVAGIVIETLPGGAAAVAARLAAIDGLAIRGSDGDRRLAAVWTTTSGQALERAAEGLLRADEAIVGIFPTYVGETEDDEAAGPEGP
jgi:hypothetical protein